MSNILRVQWTITPSTPPQPWLACSRCRDIRPFRCSGKFRLNANGKRLDAWLIYRCGSCDNTWNKPVLERRNRRQIDPLFLHALETNDPHWIRRYAFDVASLRNRAERVEEFMDFDVRKRLQSAGPKPFSKLEILLAVSAPTNLRTDRLLASELGLSRKRIDDLAAKGSLALAGSRALRKSVRDGLQIVLDLGAETDGELIVQAAGALPLIRPEPALRLAEGKTRGGTFSP
jgi:hypothetical protein